MYFWGKGGRIKIYSYQASHKLSIKNIPHLFGVQFSDNLTCLE